MMNLDKAISILGISNIGQISKSEIKKAWKNKIKSVHPDKAMDAISKKEFHKKTIELNTAYELVIKMKDTIGNINKDTNTVYIITLENLIRVYNGEEVHVDGSKVDLRFMRNNNIVVQIDYNITLNDVNIQKWCLVKKNKNDNYNLTIQVEDSNTEESKDLILSIMDKQIKTSMSTKELRISLKFKYDINVNVLIERVQTKDE